MTEPGSWQVTWCPILCCLHQAGLYAKLVIRFLREVHVKILTPLESNPGEPRKGLRNIYFNKGCQQSQNGQSKDLCRRSQAYISPPFPESSLCVVSLLHVFPHLTGRCWQGCTGLPCSPAGLLFLNRLLPGRLPPLLAFEGFTLWQSVLQKYILPPYYYELLSLRKVWRESMLSTQTNFSIQERNIDYSPQEPNSWQKAIYRKQGLFYSWFEGIQSSMEGMVAGSSTVVGTHSGFLTFLWTREDHMHAVLWPPHASCFLTSTCMLSSDLYMHAVPWPPHACCPLTST